MRITSLELWESLEEKVLNVSNSVKGIDEILSARLKNLVNHFNGNMAKGTQFVCLESIDQIIQNTKRESYYRDRKYNQTEIALVMDLGEDLLTLGKVLTSEYRGYSNKKEEKVVEKLPNINVDKAMDMFNIKK